MRFFRKKEADNDTEAGHLRTGRRGEREASAMLQKRGWKILDANWTAPPLELDLVCRDGDTIVFVEVKTRKAGSMARPDEAFTPKKRAHIIKAARLWLSEHDAWQFPCRFDLVTVTRTDEHYTTELFQHVIELSFDSGDPVGGRHTAWQPW